MENKVNLIIVNYLNYKYTIECLESILKSDYKNLDIIIIDNSPDDTSIKKLQNWAEGELNEVDTQFTRLVYPLQKKPLDFISLSEKQYLSNDLERKHDLIIVKAKSNNGFAAANNIALKKIMNSRRRDEYVFLLNNDTVLVPDTISNLINNYKKENFGIIGCTLLEYYKPNYVQSVGGCYNKVWGTTNRVLGGMRLEAFKKKIKKDKIDYPEGAAMFLSTYVLNEIGLLDESYFLFFEELDWIERSKNKYLTTYFDNCFVYHKGGASISKNNKSYIADKYSIINRINFSKKHNQKYLGTVYLGVFLSIMKRILLLKFSRSFRLIKDVLKNES